MPVLSRRTFLPRRTSSRLAVAAVAAGAASLTILTSLSPVQAAVRAPAGPAAVTLAAAKPGLTGSPITVTNNAEFSGYDLATGPNGTAYLGWIGNTGAGREVHLCTLPRGATRCAGGVQTIASAPDPTFASTAAGLLVLVSRSNLVTLIWMHSTAASENGPEGDEIAIATSQAGGRLSAERDVSAGPSFGYFLDAALAPNGSIWAVTNPSGAGSSTVHVTKALAPSTSPSPRPSRRARVCSRSTAPAASSPSTRQARSRRRSTSTGSRATGGRRSSLSPGPGTSKGSAWRRPPAESG